MMRQRNAVETQASRTQTPEVRPAAAGTQCENHPHILYVRYACTACITFLRRRAVAHLAWLSWLRHSQPAQMQPRFTFHSHWSALFHLNTNTTR